MRSQGPTVSAQTHFAPDVAARHRPGGWSACRREKPCFRTPRHSPSVCRIFDLGSHSSPENGPVRELPDDGACFSRGNRFRSRLAARPEGPFPADDARPHRRAEWRRAAPPPPNRTEVITGTSSPRNVSLGFPNRVLNQKRAARCRDRLPGSREQSAQPSAPLKPRMRAPDRPSTGCPSYPPPEADRSPRTSRPPPDILMPFGVCSITDDDGTSALQPATSAAWRRCSKALTREAGPRPRPATAR